MREKTPQTPACLHASPKASVSGPGMVVAVAIISSLSYMMPWVEYSGKMIRSMPGRPCFVPFTTSQILRTLAITCVHGARGRASAQETVLSRRLSRARPITSSCVWRRGILYWKTQVPTVSGLDEMSPWRDMSGAKRYPTRSRLLHRCTPPVRSS